MRGCEELIQVFRKMEIREEESLGQASFPLEPLDILQSLKQLLGETQDMLKNELDRQPGFEEKVTEYQAAMERYKEAIWVLDLRSENMSLLNKG
jgi:hypothetical protein